MGSPPIGGTVAGIDDPATAAVSATNRSFYEAFESGDIDAMSDVWDHGEAVSCTHPGWQTLRGWAAVSSSWFALFQAPGGLQFILTNESVTVHGDIAWVTIDENLIGDGATGGTVAATNIFRHDGARWRMVLHHGSPVANPV